MIFGNINQEKTYEFLPENVKACFKYVKEHDTYNKKDIEKFKAEKEIEESEVNLVNHQLQFNEL